ncbi:MAG: hypothetical protein ACRDKJ_00030 [Actinomycetota bacterium]
MPPTTSAITLSVPARPEALGIVRLVLMSCGAAAGIDIDEIFARSHEIVESFTNVLMSQPEASTIVIRTQTGAHDVDLVPFDRTNARP